MSLTFTKLFSSITESTVWCEPSSTRIVWITMLAMADSHGRVWASIPGLANRARVSIHECEAALQTFSAPDPYSRTPDNEGRRIEAIDGGWRLLNHGKYRAIRDEESAKESKRRYINARREEERKAAEGVEQSRTQSNSVDRSRDNAEADAEADTEDQKRPTVLSPADADDQSPGGQAKGEPIPYQQVVETYNRECGDLFPMASRLTDKRRKAIRARWMADTKNPDERKRTNSVGYWQRYFAFCRHEVKFFNAAASGDTKGKHANWRPDFDFLMTENAWLGVREGRYQ